MLGKDGSLFSLTGSMLYQPQLKQPNVTYQVHEEDIDILWVGDISPWQQRFPEADHVGCWNTTGSKKALDTTVMGYEQLDKELAIMYTYVSSD